MRTWTRVAVAVGMLAVPGLVHAPAAVAVEPVATSITTTLHGDEQSGVSIAVAPFSPVHDSALLTGANVATASGTVTYGVYSDFTCEAFAESAGTKTVTNGVVPNSDDLVLDPGLWYWKADYSGDANNAPSSSCNEELFVMIAAPGISALDDAHLWLGLRNSDDQGTKLDVRVQLYKNDSVVAQGLRRCVANLTRNPAQATEAVVPWDPFAGARSRPGDVFTVKLSARIGTNADGSACGGHANATGMRVYYDGGNRQSRFNATVSDIIADVYFHSDGGACDRGPKVTTRFINFSAPAASDPAKCQDSGAVKYADGNSWSDIGTWTMF